MLSPILANYNRANPQFQLSLTCPFSARDSIYFDTQSSADPAVFRIRLADRKLEKIASLKSFRRVVLPYQGWIGLTPEESPLLMRDTGTQEVYALDFEEP